MDRNGASRTFSGFAAGERPTVERWFLRTVAKRTATRLSRKPLHKTLRATGSIIPRRMHVNGATGASEEKKEKRKRKKGGEERSGKEREDPSLFLSHVRERKDIDLDTADESRAFSRGLHA